MSLPSNHRPSSDLDVLVILSEGTAAPVGLEAGTYDLVRLTGNPTGPSDLAWDFKSDPPLDDILGGRVYRDIHDATGLPDGARQALLLGLFPALGFGGRYVIHAPGETLATALARLGHSLALGRIEQSRGRILQGQSAQAVTEATVASVTAEPSRWTILRRPAPTAPLRLLRATALSDMAATVHEVTPAQAYERRRPVFLDTPPHHIERMDREIAKGPPLAPAGRVGVLKDVVIMGDGMVTTTDRILEESLHNVRRQKCLPHLFRITEHSYATLGWEDPITELTQPNLVLLKQSYDGNYGHWLLDTLPRVGLIEDTRPVADCHYILRGWEPQYIPLFKESLKWGGVPEDRILITQGSPIRVPELLFPTPMTQNPWVHAPFALDYLATIAARVQAAHPAAVSQAPERVYLSRNRFGRRILQNEAEIAAILEARGYAIIHPETLSFTEQVLAVARARFIVGNMGAALTNVAFAPLGARVLALATEHMPDDFFWDITSQRGGEYFSLHGPASQPDKGMQSDFTIAADRFHDALATFDPMSP